MKKILLLLFVTLSLSAADVNWFHSYAKAANAAKTSNKPMMLFMNKPGCGACQYMKDNVFTNAQVIDYLNKHFVAVSLDIHKNDAPKDLQVNVTPVFHFLKSDGSKSIETLMGGKGVKKFMPMLEKALAASH